MKCIGKTTWKQFTKQLQVDHLPRPLPNTGCRPNYGISQFLILPQLLRYSDRSLVILLAVIYRIREIPTNHLLLAQLRLHNCCHLIIVLPVIKPLIHRPIEVTHQLVLALLLLLLHNCCHSEVIPAVNLHGVVNNNNHLLHLQRIGEMRHRIHQINRTQKIDHTNLIDSVTKRNQMPLLRPTGEMVHENNRFSTWNSPNINQLRGLKGQSPTCCDRTQFCIFKIIIILTIHHGLHFFHQFFLQNQLLLIVF